MEIKDILPILGVALGWGLSELGGAIKARAARARAIRKSITALYKLNFEMLQIKMAQEFYKNNNPSSLAEWERGRQRSFEQYSDVTDETKKNIDEAVSLISQEYPLIAFRLGEAINKYNFLRNRKLDSFVEKQEVYMKMLSGFELGQIASQHIVEKTIFKLAFKVDIVLWAQLKLDTKKFKKNVKNGDLVHSSQIFSRKKSNKSSQQDAASGASA
ncbi:hypothetical protein [Oceanospirillum sanctuarii]|uniref:hypothetical protein n=1 Tax=Oceanospirillum sanctuarii TaxID=1434821 RepID=UPI000A3A6B0E|nr:hypothetical protein [Oceanospirillum sanctuarii]